MITAIDDYLKLMMMMIIAMILTPTKIYHAWIHWSKKYIFQLTQ